MNPPAPVNKTRRAGHGGKATGDNDPADEAGDVVTILCHSLMIENHNLECGTSTITRCGCAFTRHMALVPHTPVGYGEDVTTHHTPDHPPAYSGALALLC